MGKIKVILIDDHTIVRQSIAQYLINYNNFDVIAQAGTGRMAINLVEEHFPDIAIIDISMPDLNGIEATKRILAINSKIKVIALSMHSEKIYVMGMLSAGATGYLIKSCPFSELVHAITVVLSGKIYLCPDVTHHVVNNSLNPMQDCEDTLISLLSRREREVLQLISEGHKNKIIAQKLNICQKTVDVHRANLKKKLDIHSTAELTKFAIAEGITALSQY